MDKQLGENREEPLWDVETIIPILGDIPILGGLDDAELHVLFRIMKKIRYSRNEIIFSQGDMAHYIYVVKKGRIKMYLQEDQTALELAEFTIGQCFGETSLIGIQPHSATTVAEEDTELMVLSGKALHNLYKEKVDLFAKIILNISRETCRRLVRTDDVLLHYVLNEKRQGKVQ